MRPGFSSIIHRLHRSLVRYYLPDLLGSPRCIKARCNFPSRLTFSGTTPAYCTVLMLMPAHGSVLLIEDSPGQAELFRLALAQAGVDVTLSIEHNAERALHFLADGAEREALPSVILLDWHLHNMPGDKWLSRLRQAVRFAPIPVVVFTTSDRSSDMAAGYSNGANGYVVKPATVDALVHFIADLCGYWLKWNCTGRAATQC